MTEIARELRALSLNAMELCRQSSVNSIAYPAFAALADYLCLRAYLIEVESRSPTHCPKTSSEDHPKENP